MEERNPLLVLFQIEKSTRIKMPGSSPIIAIQWGPKPQWRDFYISSPEKKIRYKRQKLVENEKNNWRVFTNFFHHDHNQWRHPRHKGLIVSYEKRPPKMEVFKTKNFVHDDFRKKWLAHWASRIKFTFIIR